MAGPEMVLPHTWRPFGVRMAGVMFGGALVLVGAVSWFAFPPDIRAQFTPFQRGTLVFLILVAFSAWFALVRSRVVAEDLRLVVVNGYKRREFEWAEVIA
ncbi:MAG: PH domain-containing protein, partial [Nocardioides sp.]|nr:PH domain-containing protein [Nocardioides sp.]